MESQKIRAIIAVYFMALLQMFFQMDLVSQLHRLRKKSILRVFFFLIFQEIIKDAPLYQEKVTHLNEFSSNLMADPCLGEEERKLVRGETEMCNEKWNELVNLANAKQTR